ncbi:MAG TPA: YidC/Oxa1 family membrane protein insertase [Oscillospiraceae bacterium]|nr:YidC/Oxa1 family membrane protein insertase [Oscillospiraceae bacterium]
MGFISEIFGYPLGYIMWAIYKLIPSYGIAILLFTIVTKILLFPLSVKQQKSQVMMSAFQPKLAELQKKYANNKEKFQEEQMKLYSEEGINPMGSCLPMIIQFPVLFGIIDVVYRPLRHIMHFPKELISQASEIAYKIITAAQSSNAAWATSIKNVATLDKFNASYQNQLFIMQAYNHDPAKFADLAGFSDQVGNFNMNLFGIFDLGANPTVAWPIILIPIFAGLSQLLVTVYMQWYQKKINPSMQSMGAMNIMLYGMPLFSVWLAFTLPAGVGFYWICQSFVSFFQSILINKIYTTKRIAELVEKEKLKNKKKKPKPSYMQKLLEVQQKSSDEIKDGAPSKKIPEADKDGNIKLSKSVQKDAERKIIAEARRKMAEKYGDEITDEE